MKVLVSVGIEGVRGATAWDEARKESPTWREFARQMTAEAAAACEGAFAAGAQHVVVKDSHGDGRNITAAGLPPRTERPYPTVEVLAELAGDGAALELAVGTGRVALPLAARGAPVSGTELSTAMADQLHAKDAAGRIDVTIGDTASTRVPGDFRLVYLVFRSIVPG